MAICVMAVVGVPPCQCFSPDGIEITSPGWISSIGPPSRCAVNALGDIAEKELFWIENTTKRFRDGYNHLESIRKTRRAPSTNRLRTTPTKLSWRSGQSFAR